MSGFRVEAQEKRGYYVLPRRPGLAIVWAGMTAISAALAALGVVWLAGLPTFLDGAAGWLRWVGLLPLAAGSGMGLAAAMFCFGRTEIHSDELRLRLVSVTPPLKWGRTFRMEGLTKLRVIGYPNGEAGFRPGLAKLEGVWVGGSVRLICVNYPPEWLIEAARHIASCVSATAIDVEVDLPRT